MSANITPKSKATAALKPFVALVSISTKKTGPIIKAKKKPNGIAVCMSSIIYSVIKMPNKYSAF